jgi:Mg/Co/Ni transporter MgtE
LNTSDKSITVTVQPGQRSALAMQIRTLPPDEAAAVIERVLPGQAAEALQDLNPAIVQSILAQLDKGTRRLIAASAPPEVAEQWKRNTQYSKGTIGHMMEAPLAVFRPEMTVGDAVEALRPLVQSSRTCTWPMRTTSCWAWSRCATSSSPSATRSLGR